MSSKLNSKEVYTRLCTLKAIWYGPVPVYAEQQSKEVNQLFEDVRSVAERVQVISDTELKANDVWEAALHLYTIQRGADEQYSRVIFRGQNHLWPINAKVHRSGIDTDLESRVYHYFEGILNDLAEFSECTVNDETHLATAQHYDIATDLIDFSVNPFVAVAFASLGAETPVVYFQPIKEMNRDSTHFYLPAPYVERPWVQDALFIRKNREEEFDSMRSITFPKENTKDFKFYKNGVIQPLYPKDDWLEEVQLEIRELLVKEDIEITSQTLQDFSKKYIAKKGYPKHLKINELLLAKWYDLFEDFLFWAAVIVTPAGTEVDSCIVDLLCRDNEPLVQQYIVIGKMVAQKKNLTHILYIISVLEERLEKMRKR